MKKNILISVIIAFVIIGAVLFILLNPTKSYEKAGLLYIEPFSSKVGIGESAEVKALYMPWSPPCSKNVGCSPPRKVLVKAKWVSSNPDIATISYKDENMETAIVKGVTFGRTEIKAYYVVPEIGIEVIAKGPVIVSNGSDASIKVIFPNGGEKLKRGKVYTIKWETKGLGVISIKFVNLLTGIVYTIADNVSVDAGTPYDNVFVGAGSYLWQIMEYDQIVSSGKIVITTPETNLVNDSSDAPFSIV